MKSSAPAQPDKLDVVLGHVLSEHSVSGKRCVVVELNDSRGSKIVSLPLGHTATITYRHAPDQG